MAANLPLNRGQFGRFGFVLAAAGSAVGLGNIWKFPYIAYENEGGSFVLVYLVAVLLIGAPIMFAEVLIGRRTELSPVGAFLKLGKQAVGGKAWSVVGWLGLAAGFVILSYYSVVAGWTLFYLGKCLAWSFQGFSPGEAASLGASFGSFVGNGPLQLGLHAFFMGVTVFVVLKGVQGGIERTTKMLMPVLLGILLLLVVNSIRTPGFGEAMGFLFHIGPIKATGVLEAVGHAFFTLSLGMGAMITYGSYVQRDISIPKAAGTICILDTLVAMMTSVIMFSIIFSVPPAVRDVTFTSKSSGILFTTLPSLFYDLPAGAVIAPVFFLLVVMAALTSTISLLEVVVSYFIDVRGWARRKAALVVGGTIFLGGVPSALSNGAVGWLTTDMPFPANKGSFFDMMDYLASNWLLPVGGLAIAIFTGWFLSEKITRSELEQGHGPVWFYGLWRFMLRFVAPAAILWIIWAVIGGRSFA